MAVGVPDCHWAEAPEPVRASTWTRSAPVGVLGSVNDFRVKAFQNVSAASWITSTFGASVPVDRARRLTWIGSAGLACSVLVGLKDLPVVTWMFPFWRVSVV